MAPEKQNAQMEQKGQKLAKLKPMQMVLKQQHAELQVSTYPQVCRLRIQTSFLYNLNQLEICLSNWLVHITLNTMVT